LPLKDYDSPMNYPRIAAAVVAATLADFVYGFAVYGNLLSGSFLAQPGIYRSTDAQMAYMPVGAAGILLAMVAATILFARGNRRRGGAAGALFGLLLAMFTIGSCVVVNYATLNMTSDHALKMIAAASGEWLLVGTVIGVVYRPR
jgi:hypothetical protein